MGSVFTCPTTGDEPKAECTFGDKCDKDDQARTFIHHSLVPYSGLKNDQGARTLKLLSPNNLV